MKKNVLTIGVIIAVLVILGWVALREDRANEGAGEGGVSDLVFKDYAGGEVGLADLNDRPLVVNAWASWCPFCREELKDFAEVQKEIGDEVLIVAVNRSESPSTARKYSDDLGVTDGLLMLLDESDSLYRTIGGFAMPETIFINRDGEVVFHKRGQMSAEELKAKIDEWLII